VPQLAEILLGAGGLLVACTGLWIQYRSKWPRRVLQIDQPAESSTDQEWVVLTGKDAPRRWKVLLLTSLMAQGKAPASCWLQPGEADPDSHGGWRHRCNLKAMRDRLVYALAVRDASVPRIREMFTQEVPTVADLEKRLHASHVRYRISEGRRLQRTPPSGPHAV